MIIEKCVDCGAYTRRQRRDQPMPDPQAAARCGHYNSVWSGSNAFIRKWTCKDCGASGQQPASRPPATQSPGGFHEAGAYTASSMTPPLPPQATGNPLHGETMTAGQGQMAQDIFTGMMNRRLQRQQPMNSGEIANILQSAIDATMVYGAGGQLPVRPPGRAPTASAAASTPGTTPPAAEWPTPVTPPAVVAAASPVTGIPTPSTTMPWSALRDHRDTKKVGCSIKKDQTYAEVYEDGGFVTCVFANIGEQSDMRMRNLKKYFEDRERYDPRWRRTGHVAVRGHMDVDPDKFEVIAILDDGCNATCRGSLWREQAEKVLAKYGKIMEWTDAKGSMFRGIGGGSVVSHGVRTAPVGLQLHSGECIEGIVESAELEGSNAPLLLSAKAQKALGLAHDVSEGTCFSKVLKDYLDIVQLPNGLHGLRLTDYVSKGMDYPDIDSLKEDSNGLLLSHRRRMEKAC